MLVLVVSLKVKPEMRAKFLEAAEDDSTCSVRDEPGCLRFDVVQDQAYPNHFFFYEVYRDEAALEAHRKTPHYPRWRQAAEVCLAEPSQVTRAASVFPRAYR